MIHLPGGMNSSRLMGLPNLLTIFAPQGGQRINRLQRRPFEYFIKTPKAQPKNNMSYDTPCNHIKDKMMKCRFQGFIEMLPWFRLWLCLIRRLLKCVVKKSVLDKAITPFSVSSINLFSDKKKTFINENCLPMTKVKLPTGTKWL